MLLIRPVPFTHEPCHMALVTWVKKPALKKRGYFRGFINELFRHFKVISEIFI